MRIFEKDLFNFIFHPKALNFYKFKYIKGHVNKFRNELSILIKTFEAMEQKFGTPLLYKIKDKILKTEKKEEEIEHEVE